jgi:3-methyladenine DNA glycosylase AlkC
MATPLKELYNQGFFQLIAPALSASVPAFNFDLFTKMVFLEGWDNLELKGRMRRIAKSLHSFMPASFPTAANHLEKMVMELRSLKLKESSVEFMFIPDYIELYGKDNPSEAFSAMESITSFTSCEFAIRPFFIHYPQKTISRIIAWSLHQDLHVRRLSTEGCRPRLPWAMSLPAFKKDPTPIIHILENLKNDPSEYVRRSVANNLNDISKDHPDLAFQLAKRWAKQSKQTKWVAKHGLRTLLKSSHQGALNLFGFSSPDHLVVSNFQLLNPTLNFGDPLTFHFRLKNISDSDQKVRIVYKIDFLKSNHTHSGKVFKLSERILKPQEEIQINRSHAIKPITTRKYYPGKHYLTIVINGAAFGTSNFHLVMP